eukprot:12011514-Karenia_brevis.AAC.1
MEWDPNDASKFSVTPTHRVAFVPTLSDVRVTLNNIACKEVTSTSKNAKHLMILCWALAAPAA